MSAVIESFIPPNSIEAEMCTVGAMMLSAKAVELVLEFLNEDDFYLPSLKIVYGVIRKLATDNKSIDIVTVKNELVERKLLESIGGVEFLIQVAESVPSSANALDYARIVSEKAVLRRLDTAGHEIIKSVHDSDLDVEQKVDSAEQAIFNVSRTQKKENFKVVRTVAGELMGQIDLLLETGQPILGTKTGLYDLDKMTGGLYPGELTIVAARPGMGKTAFALRMALGVAQANVGAIAFFSLEMSAQQLVRRLVSSLARTPMNILKREHLSSHDYDRLVDACERLYDMPIFIDDNTDVSPLDIKGRCRRLKAEHGLGMVVVDYLQLMRSSKRTENRVQEIGDIARGLKNLSKELEVPVIALSQLNRGVEQRENPRPMLSDLRESGSIEAEADLVMFLFRKKYYERLKNPDEYQELDPTHAEEAEVIVGKHRNGPTGTITVGFIPAYVLYENHSARST